MYLIERQLIEDKSRKLEIHGETQVGRIPVGRRKARPPPANVPTSVQSAACANALTKATATCSAKGKATNIWGLGILVLLVLGC